ncbi:hypothetical protein QAD02_000394 [Eretmocerus hayati]|uniref:Uncharacterized protein n=1 Tax=Eretmocerus hayati TaxID=131215 RepID=A0ACC2NHU8_9HYME|nr:hypothetical protein QAD02_000394 [Eretmocerus hayati]
MEAANSVKLQRVRTTGAGASETGRSTIVTAAASGDCSTRSKQLEGKCAGATPPEGSRTHPTANHQQQQQRQQRKRCVCFPKNYGPSQFPAEWAELRSDKLLCDGAIKCGSKSKTSQRVFLVHRAILSVASPYFRALFTSSLNGTIANDQVCRELELPDVEPDAFELLLDYAYTGSCRVDEDNVQTLLPLSDRLQVLGVVQLCCRFLLKQLRPHNCLGICKFARHYFCHDLEERGRKYIRHHFKQIVRESSEFRELSCEELEQILRDDELNARNEELVFEAVKHWVEWRIPERSQHLSTLLRCPRYGLMRQSYFHDQVVTWKLAQNQECKKALRSAELHFEERKSKRRQKLFPAMSLENELLRPRVPCDILFTVGGWSLGAPTNFVETYDNRADRWFLSSFTDNTPRAYHGVCALEGLLYVIGGYDGFKYFNSVRCFEPVSKKWHERACMQRARCYVSVAVQGGKIYALGGNNGLARLSSCERYDPRTNQWDLISSMSWPRSDASAAALDGRIYVVGGFDGLDILSTAEVYDVASDQWSFIEPMSTLRTGMSLVAYRNCLYVIGGFDGYERLSTCERYNPSQPDEWQEIPEMLNPRSSFATAVLDDMIFVIGGYFDPSPVAHVECYDGESNEWYDASPMNLSRSALSACVISGLPNARDYSYHRGERHQIPSLANKQRRNKKRTTVVAAPPGIVG